MNWSFLDTWAWYAWLIWFTLFGTILSLIVLNIIDRHRNKKKEHGDPIHLTFRCGDWFDNLRPPVMTKEQRETAIDQALHTQCHNCAPWDYAQMGPGWLPELQLAMTDAWGEESYESLTGH